MKYKPQEIPEGVTLTPIHPLVHFAYLLGTVVISSALIYLVLGVIATQLITRISPDVEQKIAQQMLSGLPEPNLPEYQQSYSQQQQYLENLLTSLHQENTTNSLPLTIRIHKNKQANAAIFPGGHIIVTTALLAEAEAESENKKCPNN